MEIKDILSPDCTSCAVKGSSKKRILQEISNLASAKLGNIDSMEVLSSLLCREKMGSTGIGNGIALPHGRLDHLDKTIAVAVTCAPAIEFDAIDDQKVDIFFAILVPKSQTEGHLQTLAMIATKLSDKQIIKHIRKAASNQELYELLT